LLVSELLSESSSKLKEAGVISATVDAELITCFCLGISRSELSLMVATNQEFPQESLDKFQLALARRVARQPLQHITGTAPFRHLELKVGPGVFTQGFSPRVQKPNRWLALRWRKSQIFKAR